MDPVSELLAQPIRLDRTKAPSLSDIAVERMNTVKEYAPSEKLPYMTYDQVMTGAADVYSPSDFKTVGQKIRDNVVRAIETRFPVVGEKYTLKVEDVHYEKPKQTSTKEEKEVLLNDGSLNDRLKGTWVLYDNATGKEVSRKNATLLNVPRMTSRGTFIRNGSEIGLKHMFRLRSGVYTHIKNNGRVSAHINPEQTTGQQMSIEMEPSTGVFSISRGTRTFGLLPMLRAAGVPDDVVKSYLGEDLYRANLDKYGKLMNSESQMGEYKQVWDENIAPIKLDAETTESTLGKGFSKMDPDVLLRASGRILQVSKTMSDNDTDDRDSLRYQRVMGPADYIPERIVRDGGGLLRKLFNTVTKSGNLDAVVTGAFQPHVDSVFLDDKHAGYIDGSSPMESLDFANMISRIGEGGIGSLRAAPAETRGVNDSYLGFIDPIRSPECCPVDTEVLTKDGWKQISAINTGDFIAGFIDGNLVFTDVLHMNVYDYDGELIGYDDTAISFLVTPDHRCVFATSDDGFNTEVVRAKDWDIQNHNKVYVVLGPNEYGVWELDSSKYFKQHYKGKVYCPTVIGGMIVIKRNNAHKGVISGNSLKVGLDIYLTAGIMKDSSGKLYNRFKDKTGKPVVVPMDVTARSIVATPEFYDPKANPNEFIPAMYQGKGIEYVKRKDVDFYVDNSNTMMSIGAGMIPLIGGIRSNRTLMGCFTPGTMIHVCKEGGELQRVTADSLLSSHEGCGVLSMSDDRESLKYIGIKRVVKHYMKDFNDTRIAAVNVDGLITLCTMDHKWLVKDIDDDSPEPKLITTAELYDGFMTGTVYKLPCLDDSHKLSPSTVRPFSLQGRWALLTSVAFKEASELGVEYVVDIDVDDNVYMLANGLFTHNSKYANQAVPLQEPEAPLVQRTMMDDEGNQTTTERFISKQLGAKYAPVAGKVLRVDADSIVIAGRDGVKHEIDLYNEYPANQKGFIHNTALVKPGDTVSANQILAKSNYTDDEGTAALGANLKVAFLTARNAGTFEDSITISESAAKKLSSTQLYKLRGDTSDDIEYSKSRYLSLFKDDFTPEQLDKIGDDGLPKPGVVFNMGDPVYLGVQTRDIGVHGLAKNAAVPYVTRWEHSAPGTVTNVVQGKKHLTVYTKAITPMEVGDKLCFDDQTEILTDQGWKLFKDLDDTERVLTMDTQTFDTWMTTYSDRYSYKYKGKMYRLKTDHLDICTTPDHEHLIAVSTHNYYLMKLNAKQVMGHSYFHIVGQDVCNPSNYKPAQTENTEEGWVDYDGRVYCVTVPYTHTVFVRRNGKTVWSGNSSRWGAKGTVGCYDDKTSIFTDKGFKPFTELTLSDNVAVFDPDTCTAHFENPTAIQRASYNGPMYGYSDKNLDWLVTPNHDMWAKPSHKNHKRHPENAEFHRRNVQAIHGKSFVHRISAAFEHSSVTINEVTIDPCEYRFNAKNTNHTFPVLQFAKFLGLWLAEGHLVHTPDFNEKHWVVITQKRDDNDKASHVRCDKIEALMNELGFTWNRHGIKYNISHKGLCKYLSRFGKARDKFIPEEIFTIYPREAQEALLEYMYMGDGDKTGVNDLRYNTCSSRLRDDIVRLYTLLGKRANWVTTQTPHVDSRGVSHDYLYRVSVTDRQLARSKNCRDRVIRPGYYIVNDYQGTIHCCTVSTGIILVQRNGKSMWCGNSILPDEEMPKDSSGNTFDILQSPLGLPSRLNTSMLAELALAKIARKHGIKYQLPDFLDESIIDYVDRELKKYGEEPDEDVYDPVTGKTIPQIQTGELFFYKLKHMAELKERGRSTGTYSSEDVPLKGEGAARRLGGMESSAVFSGGGMEVLRDAKIVRGQRNDEFWRDYRSGKYPETPGFPLVHQKFFAHLKAAGVNLEDRGDRVHLYGATDSDLRQLTGNRQVTKAATFESKNMQPIQGGLFDPTIFGADGDQWGYVDLPEPVLNPIMFKTVGSVLGWKDKELTEYLEGSRELNGKFGTQNLIDTLNNIDLPKELARAKQVLKSDSTTLEQRDMARKRIRAIEPMLREGKKPADFFFTRMPILPPRFRPVTAMSNGVGIAADANFLYKRMMDAAEDLREAKEVLPEEMQLDARKQLYSTVNAVTGLTPTDDPKLEAKGVAGVLKWAFGKGSPKAGSLHRKVFGANLDLGSLGTITPDNSLTIDQVGIPERSAWKMFEPFVVRRLVQQGASVIDAMKGVLDQTDEARRALVSVMKERPVLLNRAPTLWRYGIQGQYPVLVEGNAIRVNPNICKLYGADFDGNCLDFDSKILVKLSQSALDFFERAVYINSNANQEEQKEEKMSVTKESLFGLKMSAGVYLMSIGKFPKVGESFKDKNGADVYGLPSGIELLSADPVTGEHKFCKATSFTEEKDCECVKVTIDSREVIVSSNATMAVFDHEAGRLVKVPAIEHNDRLVPVFKQCPVAFGNKYDRDFGWWLGALISDGWVTDRTVGYTKVEDNKRAEFIRIARTIHENFVANEYRSGKTDKKLAESVKVHLNGVDLAKKCMEFGIYATEEGELNSDRAALRKQIPYEMIHNGSEEFLYGLLSGFLDGDGSISKNTSAKNVRFNCRLSTSSPYLRETFEILLYRLGIRWSTTVTPPRNWSKESYSICPSTVDMCSILDKLTCIGEHEVSLINEWKNNISTKDDKDIVPISKAELDVLKKNKLHTINMSLYDALNRRHMCTRSLAMKYVDFLKQHAPEFVSRLYMNNTLWRPVSSVEDAGKRDVYDFAVPDTKVFAANTGVVIYDSMTTHVPVSKEAVKAIDEKMLPSRNLLSPIDTKAHFIPVAEFAQGLYLASRTRNEAPIRFKTKEDMMAALNRGEIKIDTPVVIG